MSKRPALALFLFLFSLYLCTYAPHFHSSDGIAMFSTAESLVRRGAFDVEQIRWMGLQQGTFGLDGLLYSRKGLGQPLLALPLTWLGLVLPWFGPATATLLFGSLLTAFTGVLIFWFLERLDYRRTVGLTAALIFGTGTMAWPYAKTFFSDTLAGTLLLIAALTLLVFKQNGRSRYAFIAGLSLAWAVATRYAEGVFLPVFGLIFLACLWKRSTVNGQQSVLKTLFSEPALYAFAAPIVAMGVSLMAFNLSRYGDPLNTGYLPQETFSAVWWQGIAGQLFSPGRGLLLYNPILLLTFLGIRPFWRRHKLEATGVLAVILIHLLLYGKWFMWHGGFAWGARFMVATLPFLVILVAPALEKLFSGQNRLLKTGFGLLWGVSIITQIPGLAVNFDLWQNRLVETGLPLFAPITFFRTEYSPLWQTWQLITPPNLDVAWAVDGKIAWGLLVLLGANLLFAGWNLYSLSPAGGRGRGEQIAALIFTLVTTAMFLSFVHQSQPADLQAALGRVNEQLPNAALVYHDPLKAFAVSELYAGHGPVLGLGAAEPDRLDAFTANQPAVWWLPTFAGEIESRLLARFGVAASETFGEQRLLLLAQADGETQHINAQLGASITLTEARLSARAQPDAPFAVTLVWHAEQTPSADYQVFIHLLDSGGKLVAQTDGQPGNWTRPTGGWQPGETIIDPHALWVPDLAPGDYTLIGGLYEPATGKRLLTAGGENSVVLGRVSNTR